MDTYKYIGIWNGLRQIDASPWLCLIHSICNLMKMINTLLWTWKKIPSTIHGGCPGGSDGKDSVCNAGDPGLIPRLGRSSGDGKGYPLSCFCLENPMDRGASQAIVHGVAKIWTQLSDWDFHLLWKNIHRTKTHYPSI